MTEFSSGDLPEELLDEIDQDPESHAVALVASVEVPVESLETSDKDLVVEATRGRRLISDSLEKLALNQAATFVAQIRGESRAEFGKQVQMSDDAIAQFTEGVQRLMAARVATNAKQMLANPDQHPDYEA